MAAFDDGSAEANLRRHRAGVKRSAPMDVLLLIWGGATLKSWCPTTGTAGGLCTFPVKNQPAMQGTVKEPTRMMG